MIRCIKYREKKQKEIDQGEMRDQVLSHWSIIFLSFLIVLMLGHRAWRASYGEWKSVVDKHNHHMDPSVNIFFTLKDLKINKTMLIHFPNKNPSKSPHLLSQQEANLIPFSSTNLSYLVNLFSLSPDSPQAKAIAYTLHECELKPLNGETKLCATSLESMLDYARSVFGDDTRFKVLTTNYVIKPRKDLENYRIVAKPKEVLAEKVIACHKMPYPYAVFYCHAQKKRKNNRLFEVLVEAENGARVEGVAICHMDTSQWNSDHPSFKLLGIKPGTLPVCHFFPVDNLVWLSIKINL